MEPQRENRNQHHRREGIAMETSRRAFVGMGVAAAAMAGPVKMAAAATDPMKAPFARFWVAAVTPVDRNGNFDNGANDALLAWWKAQGADGVLLLGTTGEAQSFSVAERKKVLEMAARNKHGLDFIVGTGTANAPESIELSRHAADHGADSVLVVPPYYDKNPKGAGVVVYFDKIFAQVKTPVRYYHIPRVTGVPVEPSVFAALAHYPNLVGVKDSNGDAAEFEAITAALPGRNVVTGTDNLLENTLAHGHGCILASGNVFTKQVAAIYAAYRAGGDTRAAIQHAAAAQKAFRDTVGAGGEAVNKYAVSLLAGMHEVYSRAPTLPLDEALKPRIAAAVAN
jgi:4-hydroxy-tetrahydrodipicolinate synthase